MHDRHLPWLVGLLILTGGCTDKDDGSDSGTIAEVGPCQGGGWGAISDPETGLHVRFDGNDETADGSVANPYATLDAALAASRAGGALPIAVGPGTFDATLVLSDDSGDGASDDGLAIEGCGSEETVLAGTADDSVLRAVGVQDLRVAGLRFEGGRRSLWLRAGSTVVVDDVAVYGGTRLGIVVEGSSTLVELIGVEVHDTAPESLISGSSMGYGLSVDSGTVTMRGGGIYGSTGVGVLGAFATVELEDVTVSGTLAGADGTLGRGVQLQELSMAVISGTTLADNLDAGLFATRTIDLLVDGITIERTSAGVVPGSTETTGDGIVVTQGADEGSDPADFTASLYNCIIDGTDRAAVVLDGVTADLVDHTHTDNGIVVEGSSTFNQNDSVITGDVGVETLDSDSELLLNHQPVELDDYLD